MIKFKLNNRNFFVIAFSLLIAFGLFCIILFVSGLNPFSVCYLIVKGSFGGKYELSETFVKVTPILLCALAVALPAKIGLLNIGGEGQLLLGSIGSAWIAIYWTWLPMPLVIPIMFISAALFAGVWAVIPGFLRGILNINEVIVTLLMNFIALFLLEYLVHGPWRDPESFGWPYSKEFPNYAILNTIPGSRIHIVLFVGIIIALILFIVINHTNWGFKGKVIGENINAAKTVKINILKYIIITMIIAGFIAGIAGFGEVSAIQGRLRSGISPGYGYTGFLVSWLARHNFLLIIVFSIFVGGLLAGSDQLQLTAGLPYSVIEILQGLIFLFVLIGEATKNKF